METPRGFLVHILVVGLVSASWDLVGRERGFLLLVCNYTGRAGVLLEGRGGWHGPPPVCGPIWKCLWVEVR